MSAIEPYTRRMLGSVQPIIVANRAPLVLHHADPYRGTPERLVKGAGGLVTAMTSLAVGDRRGVGRAGPRRLGPHARRARRPGRADHRRRHHASRSRSSSRPARHTTSTTTSSANPLLWFIQHYLWDLAREPVVDETIHRAWADGYVKVNQLVADRVHRRGRARPTSRRSSSCRTTRCTACRG